MIEYSKKGRVKWAKNKLRACSGRLFFVHLTSEATTKKRSFFRGSAHMQEKASDREKQRAARTFVFSAPLPSKRLTLVRQKSAIARVCEDNTDANDTSPGREAAETEVL